MRKRKKFTESLSRHDTYHGYSYPVFSFDSTSYGNVTETFNGPVYTASPTYQWVLKRAYWGVFNPLDASIYSTAETEDKLTEAERKELSKRMREVVAEFRRGRKARRVDLCRLNNVSRIGGVYEIPGAFTHKEIAKQIKREKALKEKRPTTAVHHIGIEFECLCPHSPDQLIEMIVAENLHNHLHVYIDGTIANLAIEKHEEDCSMGGPNRCDCGRMKPLSSHRHEIRALIAQDELEPVLKKICSFFDRNGFFVNNSCSMHVHIDVRQRDFKVAARNLIFCQRILFSLVPKWRRLSHQCRPSYLITEPAHIYKRHAINGSSVLHKKTIEVRLHHGCINFKKAYAWIKLLCAIVDTPEIKEPVNSIRRFAKEIPLDMSHRLYLLLRMKKFSTKVKHAFPKTAEDWKKREYDLHSRSEQGRSTYRGWTLPFL